MHGASKKDNQAKKLASRNDILSLTYLNQEYCALSLFSSLVSDKDKASLAKKMVAIKKPQYGMGCLSPVELPKSLEEGKKFKLQSFVGKGSLFMFDALGFKKSWLRKSPSQWHQIPEYLEMEGFVRNMLCTNDTAERGVKLITDYAKSLTKDDDMRELILQVVEEQRKLCPQPTKKGIKAALGKRKTI